MDPFSFEKGAHSFSGLPAPGFERAIEIARFFIFPTRFGMTQKEQSLHLVHPSIQFHNLHAKVRYDAWAGHNGFQGREFYASTDGFTNGLHKKSRSP